MVSRWIALIALTLLFSGRFMDVAVRDLVMAVGAYGITRLTRMAQGGLRVESRARPWNRSDNERIR